PLLHDAGKGCIDIATGGSIKYIDWPSDARRARLHVFDPRLIEWAVHDKRGKSLGIRHQLMQEPQPLGTKLGIHGADTGDVAARLIEAGDETSLDRVAAHAEDDWN